MYVFYLFFNWRWMNVFQNSEWECVYVSVCICVGVDVSVHVYVNVYVCLWVCVFVCVSVYACLRMWTYVSMYVSVCYYKESISYRKRRWIDTCMWWMQSFVMYNSETMPTVEHNSGNSNRAKTRQDPSCSYDRQGHQSLVSRSVIGNCLIPGRPGPLHDTMISTHPTANVHRDATYFRIPTHHQLTFFPWVLF